MSERQDRQDTSTGINPDLSMTLSICSATIKQTVKLLHEAVGKLDHCVTLVETLANQYGTPASECSLSAKMATALAKSFRADIPATQVQKLKNDLTEPETSARRPVRGSPLSMRLAALGALTKEKSILQLSLEEITDLLQTIHPEWSRLKTEQEAGMTYRLAWEISRL